MTNRNGARSSQSYWSGQAARSAAIGWSSVATLGDMFARLKEAFADAEEFDHRLWAIDGTVIRAARCAAAVYEAMMEQRRADK